MLTISRSDLRTVIEHCSTAYPNEACGILAVREGRVERVYPMQNARPGPVSYEMEPAEQFRVLKEIREAGLQLGGIYHSHPCAPAVPSGIDVERAYWPDTLFPNYPGAVQVIVSLREPARPVVKAFTITDRQVDEVLLQVE